MAVIVGVKVKTNAKLVAKGLEDLGAEIPKIGRLQIYNTMVRARSRLKKPGKKVKYPFPWVSIRQKIKVLIILKHVLGIPYRRTGGYQRAFQVVKQKDGYDLVNETDRVQFIGGDAEGRGQTRSYKGRYPIIRKVVDEEVEKLPSAVVEHIRLVAEQKGFKSE